MGLGNLSIKVNADIGNFTTNLDLASRISQDRMRESAASVDIFRRGMSQAAIDTKTAAEQMSSSMLAANDAIGNSATSAAGSLSSIEKSAGNTKFAAEQMGSSMVAANDLIVSSAQDAATAVADIEKTADQADFRSLGEKVASAIGTGVGVGIFAANKAWDGFVEYSKTKALVIGVAVSAVFAAAGLGAIYTGYKVISGSLDFITGLITGDSYKSDNIDALITANNQVKEIQKSLTLTAQQASITNEAIAALGIDKGDYISVFNNAKDAIQSNTDVLDELGVKYGSINELIASANDKLNEYTEGWDRNQVATQLGLGSAEQVAAAAALTGAKFVEAGARLNDYNLGIGVETQNAAKRYTDTMREFNHNMDLTSQGFKRAIADNIMPMLTDLADFFKDGFPTAVNVFRYTVAQITSLIYGLKTSFNIAVESIIGTLSAMEISISSIAAASASAMSGDFTKAREELVWGWETAQKRIDDVGKSIASEAAHNAAAMRQAWAFDDRAMPGQAAAKGKSAPDFEAAKKIKEQTESYQKLKDAVTEKINAQNFEIQVNDKLTDGQREMNKLLTQITNGTSNLTDEQKREYSQLLQTLDSRERANRAMEEARKQSGKAKEETVSDYEKVMKTIKEKDAAQQLEIASGRTLTDVEKMRTKVLTDIEAKLFKFSDATKKSVDAQKADIETGMKKLAADEKAIAYARQAAAEHAKYVESLGAGVERLREQVAQQQEYNDRLGLTKSAIAALDAAQLENQATNKESIADTMDLMDWSGKLGDAYREQAKALRELAKAKRDGGAKEDAIEAKKALDTQAANYETAYQASNKKIGDGLYSAIANGGNSAIKKLIKDVKEWFARLVLQPIISPISNFGASLINPNAPSAQGSAGGGLGMIGNGLSAYNSLSNLGMSAGSGLLAAGNFLGSSTLASAGYAAAVPGLTSFGAGSQAAMLAAQTAEFGSIGLASTASAGATATGAGGAGLMGGASSALSAIPVWGWVAMAAIAAAAFGGGKDREKVREGVSGKLGAGAGFEGTHDVGWTKDGGWFNSDTAGTWKYNLSNQTTQVDGRVYKDDMSQQAAAKIQSSIGQAYNDLVKQTGDFAKGIGINADYLKTRTQDISFDFGKDEAETQANIAKLFADVSNDISKEIISMADVAGYSFSSLVKSGKTATQTLSRVAAEVTGVNEVMKALGFKAYELNGAGVKAADSLTSLFGGLQSMQSISASYYERYYSEAEKAAVATKNMGDEFGKFGFTLPDSTEQLRSWIEAAKALGTEAGDKTYVSLMKLTSSFASLADVTERVAASEKQKADGLAQTKSDMILRGMELMGLGEQALALKRQTQLMVMDKLLVPYQEHLNQLEDEAKARDLANKQANLAVEILRLQGKTVEATALQRKLELAAMEAGLRPQRERIYQLQDEADKLAVLQQHRSLDIQLMRAQGNEVNAIAMERADSLKGLDAYSQARMREIWATEDAKKALDKAAQDAASTAQEAQRAIQEAQQAAAQAQQAYEQRVSAAKSALQNAYNAEAGALQNIITKMQGFATAARAMQQSLMASAISPVSTDDQYKLLKAQMPSVLADARDGNQGALEKLQQFVTLSQQSSADFVDYMRDFAMAQNALDDAATSAERQARQSQSQLDMLKNQVDAILNVDKSVLSVSDAIKALQEITAGGLGMVTDAVNGQNNAKAAVEAAKNAAAKTASSKYGFVGGADYGRDAVSSAYTAPSTGAAYDRYAKFMSLATGWAKEHYDTSTGFAQSVTTDVANMLMQLADGKGISLDRALEGGLDYAKQAYARQYGQQTKVFSSADLTGNGLVQLAAVVEKQGEMLSKIAINTGNAASAATKTADVFTNGPMLVEVT